MRGIVKFYEIHKFFGVVANEGGSFIVIHHDILEDNAGRRFLQEGEEVEFDVVQDVYQGRTRMKAINVRVLDRPDEDLENYYEDVFVRQYDETRSTSGFGKRFTGDSIFLLKNHVVTTGKIKEGEYIRCRVAPPDRLGHKLWIAKHIQIYFSQQELEVEEVQSEKQ